MTRLFRLCAMMLCALVSTGVSAAEFRAIRAGESVTLRPDRAYILVRCQSVRKCIPPTLLRIPSEEEARADEEARRAAYAKLKNKGDYTQFKLAGGEKTNLYMASPKDALEVADDTSSFVVEVTPGTYVAYGISSDFVPFSCFCLGTVRAEAKAGMITDFGTFALGTAVSPSPYPALASVTNQGKSFEMDFPVMVAALTPASGSTARPAAVVGKLTAAAEFHAVAPFYDPNARTPTHLPPIPGVLDYRRGQVIDVRTGEQLPDLIP